jgi:hypothetical protein
MLLPPEKQLLKHGKPIPYGVYDDLITHPGTSFWDDEGFPLKRRRSQRKTWIFYGVYSESLFAGLAIVDAGLLATAFAYFYIPGEVLFVEDKITLPLGFAGDFNPSLTDEWKLGKYRVATENGETKIQYKGKFVLDITTAFDHKGVSVVAPSPDRPFNFTYKNMLLPVKVHIEYKGKSYGISGNYGAVDFTKGYPPRTTIWNWASFIGYTDSGERMAVNMVDKFNDNMENVLWKGEERFILSEAVFQAGKPLDKGVWQIATKDKILDMRFTPSGARAENLNAGLMKSIFTQPFGKYEGTIRLGGREESFTAWGVAEEHLAVW